jgi:outer membrane protein, heavy metal efflux system
MSRILPPIVFIFVFCSYSKAQNTLKFSDALHKAKENNLFFKSQAFNLEVAQADVLTAGLKPNPILNLQPLQLLNSKYYSPETNFYNWKNQQIWVQFTKPFQTANKRPLKIELAQQNATLSKTELAESERNLKKEVATKWLEIWLIKQELELVRQVRQNIDTLNNINKIRLRNQAITELDLSRTEMLLDQYKFQEQDFIRQWKAECLRLQLLLNSEDSIDIADNELFTFPTVQKNLDSLTQLIEDNRSDVIWAKQNIKVAEADINLQKAMAKPNIEAGFIINPQNSIAYMGIYATIPLALTDRNQGNIQRSQVLKSQAEMQLKAIRLQADSEIRTVFHNYKLQSSNLRILESLQKQSQNVLNRVRYNYLRGNTTIIDFLEAQRTAYESQFRYNEALFQFRKTLIELLFVTGLINSI